MHCPSASSSRSLWNESIGLGRTNGGECTELSAYLSLRCSSCHHLLNNSIALKKNKSYRVRNTCTTWVIAMD